MVSWCFLLVWSGECPEQSDLSKVIAIQPHRVRKSHINTGESGQVVTVPGTALTSGSASTREAKTKRTDVFWAVGRWHSGPRWMAPGAGHSECSRNVPFWVAPAPLC
ncbi:hypothetical protein MJG53_007895 [Ovis ammon polii x Ovis aries]|uniref:Uncharacterized protein n=1 Tax=Ovis ammon polii x Ovis aries TaxID=2918886 RepID=A0ACB9V589_9CETA|nr:hypothetical protein MJG53_007895 [Ovis ammon polii x Ovis aries]